MRDDRGSDRGGDREERRSRCRRGRERERDEESPRGIGQVAIICAVLGASPIIMGLMSLPRAMMMLGREDDAYVLGRLTVIAFEFAVGGALMIPLVVGFFRGRSNSRQDHEDRDW